MTSVAEPFAGATGVAVVLPRNGADLSMHERRALEDLIALLQREPRELEVELGAPVRFVTADPGEGPRLLIGPRAANPDLSVYGVSGSSGTGLWLDRARLTLIVDGPTADGVYDAMSLLRTLRMRGLDTSVPTYCTDLDDAVGRVVDEVGWSYPAFALRGLDWTHICGRHADRVRSASDPLRAMQVWLAELQDGHTWVRATPAHLPLPYALWATPDAAIFTRVPPGTAAWDAGVRSGDRLLQEDFAGWWERTGAPIHARPLLAGRRLLAGVAGVERAFVARGPNGACREWIEAPSPASPLPLVTWGRMATGTGYMRVETWRDEVDAMIDAAFDDLRGCDRLIVDLRGNAGGSLNRACAFRDRFLRTTTLLGSICFSTGDGRLSEAQPLLGEPAPSDRRWRGQVRFLTDPLTFSASEDALLGL